MQLIIATCSICKLREKQVESLEQKKTYVCSSCKHKEKTKKEVV